MTIRCPLCDVKIIPEDGLEHARMHRDVIINGLILVAKSHPEDPAAVRLLKDFSDLSSLIFKIKKEEQNGVYSSGRESARR